MKTVNIILYIAFVITIILLVKECNREPEVEYVEVEVEVKVPEIVEKFDTIYKPVPYPVKEPVVDSTYYEEYIALKDSVEKNEFVKRALTINEYREVYEDTNQTINVYTKSRGEVLEQVVDYKINERTINVDIDVPVEKKNHLYGGVEAGINTITPQLPTLKGTLLFQNKKGNMYSGAFDSEGTVWGGFFYQF